MRSKKKPVSHADIRTLVLVLLTPITTLNASQALTLCVDHDGRIALELLVQDRCTCELRPGAANTAPVGMTAIPHLGGGLGLSCTDIPMPGSSSDNRMRTARSPARRHPRAPALAALSGLGGPGSLFATPITAKPGGPDPATQSLLASLACHSPLTGILLQV